MCVIRAHALTWWVLNLAILLKILYRIAGNFGEVFTLVIRRILENHQI